MATLITQAAYARARGVTKQAVSAAVKAGRIRLIDGKIDPEIADIQWQRNTSHEHRQRALGGVDRGIGAGGIVTTTPAEPPRNAPRDPEGQGDTTFLEAKTRSEQARAELFELELAQKRGELVVAEEVRRATFEKSRIARDALLALAPRLAPQVAAESDVAKCHDLIMAEVRMICQELAAGESGATRQ